MELRYLLSSNFVGKVQALCQTTTTITTAATVAANDKIKILFSLIEGCKSLLKLAKKTKFKFKKMILNLERAEMGSTYVGGGSDAICVAEARTKFPFRLRFSCII